MKAISLEEAWAVLRNNGYKNQFVGDWKIRHPKQVMKGRALTAQYMPKRAMMREVLEKRGQEGSFIGDNLGTSIYTKSFLAMT